MSMHNIDYWIVLLSVCYKHNVRSSSVVRTDVVSHQVLQMNLHSIIPYVCHFLLPTQHQAEHRKYENFKENCTAFIGQMKWALLCWTVVPAAEAES